MTSQRHNPAPGRDIPAGVVDATRACVLAVGVRRTTLTDVARRAGVSRMTLYRMVPDVTTLLLEVITRDFATLLDEAESAAARRRTARARLTATAVEVARRLPHEPLVRRVLEVDPELLLPYLTDRLGATQLLAVGHVERMLGEGMRDGSVRRGDARVMAVGLVLVVTTFVVSARLLDQVGRDDALDELQRLVDGWLRS